MSTSRIADVFCLIEDWVEGVPLSIKTVADFPNSTACATYMERVFCIGDGSCGDSHTNAHPAEDTEPVRVAKYFACPYADPTTFICLLGEMSFKLNRESLVRAHLRMQRKRHKPSSRNGFVLIATGV